ncbi:hypothetical protein L228DRAFT_282240 [Xylona heveae TC161]|uniref:Dynactin subunit 4 n=1 Tax=Xylona heveae (strain CBS 132557 / TC161) TaxID=1328760 RepID=A0A165HHD6_XYLHT|nr:hypothetical protein L228DRAFT_282240 [Xylona heveae TC161]KZF23519.1 hypothetical protein L228DRAFT_282240 [Xylona heveae TC161]
MALSFPYLYISCPCASETTLPPVWPYSNRLSRENAEDDDEEDEKTFDPRNPRANYSLYPLEHLLFCEDCRQIRCPRCALEEVLCWYCPSCLFESPSSAVKTEGNRCTRNCFQCPICTSPLSVNALEKPDPRDLSWILSCPYCAWSSLDIGIRFDRPSAIAGQLLRMRNGGQPTLTRKERDGERDRRKRGDTNDAEEEDDHSWKQHKEIEDVDDHFSNIRAFYTDQLAETSASSPFGGNNEFGYGSPGALSRIMGLYSRAGRLSSHRPKDKIRPMREAFGEDEGVKLFDAKGEDEIIERMKSVGWEGTAKLEQQSWQNRDARFLSDLRPVPTLLRTKRARRCRTCRHILTKPESKVASTRYRIRLVALNYVPTMTLKPLVPSPAPPSAAPAVTAAPTPLPPTAPSINLQALPSLIPTQFLLTLHNPLFDPVRVTLATPARTPGRFGSKVTILCPQFDIGANTDMWDEALTDVAAGSSGSEPGPGAKSRGSAAGNQSQPTPGAAAALDAAKRARAAADFDGPVQAEAGKIWDSGRNWTTIVLEVVPANLDEESPSSKPNKSAATNNPGKHDSNPDEPPGETGLEEDEDVLEIPVFVRINYEADISSEDEDGPAADDAVIVRNKRGEKKVKRELAYWCVLGVGRISKIA